MPDTVNRSVHLVSRPNGWPTPENFAVVEAPVPEPGEGQFLVRNIYMSVDPYMRGRMNDVKSYSPPFALNEPMGGGALGRVERSNHPDFQPGDLVSSQLGWREWFVSDGSGIQRIEQDGTPLVKHLGVLGGTGFTAYVGLLDIGQPKAGETVFVSGAAGATGSVAGQIAKLKGCRVVGSAGSDEKVAWLTGELGFDAAINYRTENLDEALSAACPDGIDVYYDNVGGDHLTAALDHMADFGRIVCCGAISHYNEAVPSPGPANLRNVITRQLRMQGFLLGTYASRRPDFLRDMTTWLNEGKVHDNETIVEGIEHAADAFLGLLRGENRGKMIVRLSAE